MTTTPQAQVQADQAALAAASKALNAIHGIRGLPATAKTGAQTAEAATAAASTAALAWLTANPGTVTPPPVTPPPVTPPPVTTPPGGGSTTPPVTTSTTFFVPPGTDAITAAASASGTDKTALQKIASQPQATWLGEWNSNNGTVVDSLLTGAAKLNQAAIFVLYGIPDRDLGGDSSGGYTSDAQYKSFVDSIVSAVKGRQAWFIIEPDAIGEGWASDSTLSSSQKTDRAGLLTYAATQLATVSSHVYLDTGDWLAPSLVASTLNICGISAATGISVNVSGYNTSANEEKFADSVVKLLSGTKHYVIDTSRNGNGPAPTGQWCNVQNMKLGVAPSTNTNDPYCDAYLWVKYPGQSDGDAGSETPNAPASGDWFQSYAIGLAS